MEAGTPITIENILIGMLAALLLIVIIYIQTASETRITSPLSSKRMVKGLLSSSNLFLHKTLALEIDQSGYKLYLNSEFRNNNEQKIFTEVEASLSSQQKDYRLAWFKADSFLETDPLTFIELFQTPVTVVPLAQGLVRFLFEIESPSLSLKKILDAQFEFGINWLNQRKGYDVPVDGETIFSLLKKERQYSQFIEDAKRLFIYQGSAYEVRLQLSDSQSGRVDYSNIQFKLESDELLYLMNNIEITFANSYRTYFDEPTLPLKLLVLEEDRLGY
ncbi:MAG: hypothetical protein ACN4E2_06480 [Nitrospinota bacterium]